MKTSQSGMTLVELLIVIVIITLLSTIGVPMYKRMVEKSRQAEAKTLLTGVVAAQRVLYNDWGSYGNHVSELGVELEGPPESYRYIVGFWDADCALPASGYTPSVGYNGYDRFIAQHPDYYNPPIGSANIAQFTIGRTTFQKCDATYIGHPTPGHQYRVGAQGVIKGNVDLDNPPSPNDTDNWRIDETGLLQNFNHAVHQ